VKKHPAKVLLIGWDAADWKVITPLLDAGKMPSLERLINQGVKGNIATLNPPLSPMLWSSIATGVRPYRHGIHGFTEPDPISGGVRPVSGASRKVKAVWNILNQNGYRSNVIGWWPSHPAEPINGVMVSNLYQRAPAPIGKPWPMQPGTVHPPRLSDKIAALRVHPAELTAEMLLPFIPQAAKIDIENDARLGMLTRIVADCATVHACATATMQLEPWDFMAVYYDAIDHFGHAFMRYHPPRQQHISEKDFEIYKGVVEGGYRFHDMMLGVLLKLAGEDATVILLSDHGFHPDNLRPSVIPDEPAGPAVEHRPYGIFVMKGAGIKKDELVFGTTVLDVAPTVLTLFDLPVGKDMQGKPLVQAFEEPPKISTIESWEKVDGDDGRLASNTRVDPEAAMEAVKQLVALGYIEDPGDDKEKAVADALREARYNLAQDYIDDNRHADALPLLEELWASNPDQIRFANRLTGCFLALNQVESARGIVEELLAARKRLAKEAREKLLEFGNKSELTQKEKRQISRLRMQASPPRHEEDFLMGMILFNEGKGLAALERLKKAEAAGLHLDRLHIQIGHIFLKMKLWADAERAFSQALEVDPDNAAAHLGLCLSLLPRRQNKKAAEAALGAIGLLYHYPQAHFKLGVALQRMGRIERAVEAFCVALCQNPNYAEAHERLAHIYGSRLGDEVKAEEHREEARKARGRAKAGSGSHSDFKVAIPERISSDDKDLPASEQRDSTEKNSRSAKTRRQSCPSCGDPKPSKTGNFITVVTGLPRSGTSMMMGMLRAGGLECMTDETRQADESNPRGYFEFEKVKRLASDASWLCLAQGKAIKVIAHLLPHMGDNFQLKVIFMERKLDEIMLSQKKMLKRLGRAGSAMDEDRLAEVFAGQLSHVKAMLAARNIPTLYASYLDAVEKPEETASMVKQFLGLPLDEKAMAAEVDPALYRSRENS